MSLISKVLITFSGAFVIFLYFDYNKSGKLIWSENIFQSLFFTIFFSGMMWLVGSKKKKIIKKNSITRLVIEFFFTNHLLYIHKSKSNKQVQSQYHTHSP
jgi:hypothetical protein